MAESGDGDLLQIQKEIRNQIESILKANRYNPSKCREKCLRLLDRKCAKKPFEKVSNAVNWKDET